VEQTSSLGADYVIDYTKENFIITGKTYDIILAVNGNYPLLACKRILNPNGIYVMVGGALPQIFKTILFGWAMSFGSKKIRFLAAKASQKDLKFIVTLANDGKIKPVIERHFSLDKTAEAVRYLSEGHARGKIVIKV
jgi:NADPH:quinone reductase-like Zn-dependent oxidoreductase